MKKNFGDENMEKLEHMPCTPLQCSVMCPLLFSHSWGTKFGSGSELPSFSPLRPAFLRLNLTFSQETRATSRGERERERGVIGSERVLHLVQLANLRVIKPRVE